MEGNEILIPKNRPLKKHQKTGQTSIFYGIEKTNKELKNTFGDNFNNLILKHHYKQFIERDDGILEFVADEQIKNLDIQKNMKSFKMINFTENDKKHRNMRKIKNKVIFKNSNNKNVINFRDGANLELKELTGNNKSVYDVERISWIVEIFISDDILQRPIIINSLQINNYKAKLNIPINNKITPQQIVQMIYLYVWGEEDAKGWIAGFPLDDEDFEIKQLQNGAIADVKIKHTTKIQKLTKDGDTYYLRNNIRHYKDLSNYFNAVNIPIAENKNCVIETLKYILNKFALKGMKKIFKTELEKMENNFIIKNEIPTYKMLIEFCENVKLNYDIRNFTDLKDRSSKNFNNEKTMYSIIYDNHIYLIEDFKQFNKVFESIGTNEKYFIQDNTIFNKELDKLLENNVIPKIITIDNYNTIKQNLSNTEILSYKYNDVVYLKDDENKTISNILYLCQAFNIKYTPFINEFNFISEVLSQHNIKVQKSFFPYSSSSCEVIYSQEIDDEEDNFIILDQNFAYANILAENDIIPYINILYHNFEKCNDEEEILNNYLYSIEVLKDNLFFKISDNYFGHILNNGYIKPIFKEMIKQKNIKVVEKIKFSWTKNPYQDIIIKLQSIINKTNNNNNIRKTIKNIIVYCIGKFNNCVNEFNEKIINPILKETSKRTHINDNETFYNYNDKYDIYYQTEIQKKNYTMENQKPLRTFIINNNWLKMFKLVVDKKIDPIDIYQNNTDSITIRNKKLDPRTITIKDIQELEEIGDKQAVKQLKKLKYNKDDEIYYTGKYNYLIEQIQKEREEDKYNLFGFKLEKFKKNKNNTMSKYNNTLFHKDYFKPTNKLIVNFAFAGVGKSYKINQLIKQLEKDNKKYLLIANQNSILKLYDNTVNKKTIQKIISNNIIPDEDIIIIDEIGLFDFKTITLIIEWLYKHNKDIYFYGDIYQLDAIDFNKKDDIKIAGIDTNEKPSFNLEFLKSISTEFNFYLDSDENKRNNYDIDVYKEFIKNNYSMEQIKILIKTLINDKADETKPEFINICYTNDKRDKINNEYLLKNNQTFKKDDKTKEIIINGLNIPLISNEQITINSNEIISPKEFLKLNVIDNKYILSYENENKQLINFELEPDKIFKYFNVAYCVNLYSIQGQTLTNYKYCLDDKEIYFLHKNNQYNISGGLYVLLSRIKETLTSQKITLTDINNILHKNKIIIDKVDKNNENPQIKFRKMPKFA